MTMRDRSRREPHVRRDKDHATRRPAFDKADREAPCRFDRANAARGHHQQ